MSDADAAIQPAPSEAPIPKWEWFALFVLVAAGGALRYAALDNAAVEHFDEGVYASNRWFIPEEGNSYPLRHLYAPPLVSKLIEWSIAVFGPAHLGTMFPGLLFGTLTIPLVWWVGRSWFGSAAGLGAAALAALSDFHIQYSRAALTDVILGFWLTAAVYLMWRAYCTRSWSWSIAAGLATGIAWWTKYNGWLPLAIGLAGLVPWLVLRRSEIPLLARRAQEKTRRGRGLQTPETATPTALSYVWIWCVIAAVAFTVWSPVLIGLQSDGGYAAVAANHRGYLVGLSGWLDSLARQARTHYFYFNGLSELSLVVGLALMSFASWQSHRRLPQSNSADAEPAAAPPPPKDDVSAGRGIRLVVILLGTLGIIVLTSFAETPTLGMIFVLGCVLAFFVIEAFLPHLRSRANPEISLAIWLLAAWFIGLSISTPFYRAYPRLTLPWLIAAWLMLAGPSSLKPWPERRPARNSWRWGVLLLLCAYVAAIAGLNLVKRFEKGGVPAWRPRTGLEQIAPRIADSIREDALQLGAPAHQGIEFVIYVYGEPGLFYHLARLADKQKNFVARPVSDLQFQGLQVPVYLVTGPHAQRSDVFQKEWASTSHRFTKVSEEVYRPSDLVLLDEFTPKQIRNRIEGTTSVINVYRFE